MATRACFGVTILFLSLYSLYHNFGVIRVILVGTSLPLDSLQIWFWLNSVGAHVRALSLPRSFPAECEPLYEARTKDLVLPSKAEHVSEREASENMGMKFTDPPSLCCVCR